MGKKKIKLIITRLYNSIDKLSLDHIANDLTERHKILFTDLSRITKKRDSIPLDIRLIYNEYYSFIYAFISNLKI